MISEGGGDFVVHGHNQVGAECGWGRGIYMGERYGVMQVRVGDKGHEWTVVVGGCHSLCLDRGRLKGSRKE